VEFQEASLASRPDQFAARWQSAAATPIWVEIQIDCPRANQSAVVASLCRRTPKSGPRSRRRSSKPNLQELGGKARGSIPPRASTIIKGCVAQTELEQASHKREVGGSTPPTARSFSIGDLSFAIVDFADPLQSGLVVRVTK
jgi:hypothetical protein